MRAGKLGTALIGRPLIWHPFGTTSGCLFTSAHLQLTTPPIRRPTSTWTCKEWCRDSVGDEVLSRQVTGLFLRAISCRKDNAEDYSQGCPVITCEKLRAQRQRIHGCAPLHAGCLGVSVCRMLRSKLAFATSDDAETGNRSMIQYKWP